MFIKKLVTAQLLVSPTTPNFDAVYAGIKKAGNRPEIDYTDTLKTFVNYINMYMKTQLLFKNI